MKHNLRSLLVILSVVFMFSPGLKAEPWLAMRYAQNCAACHSPGRRNVDVKGRRCTATCQGCHVSPSGGGLRNEYGVWTQQRFLRSFRSEFFHNKGTPAPTKYQKYGDMPVQYSSGAKGRNGQTFDEMAKNGAPLVVLPGVAYDEGLYGRADRQDQLIVGSREEFMARLTDDDPFRIEHRQSIFAGGDFRYFYFNGTKTSNDANSTNYPSVAQRYFSPMVLDIGIKIRPIPEKVSFVFEARNFSQPSVSQQDVEWAAEGGTIPKSAYVLVDDLPYNTYVTAGLYKPLFGYETADHTSLLNTLVYADNSLNSSLAPNDPFDVITARSGEMIYKAITVGGSPGGANGILNYSLNYIMPTEQKGGIFNTESGYSANVGARVLSFGRTPIGAALNVSYWNTSGPRAEEGGTGTSLGNQMTSINGGINWWRIIANFDYTTIRREFAPGAADTGGVLTIEPKFRLWREVYAIGQWANADTANNLKQGSSTVFSLGVKGYTINGVEGELTWVNRVVKDTVNDFKTTSDLILAQMHLYF